MEIQIKKFHQLSLDELYQILKLRVDVFVVEQDCAYPELDDNDQVSDHFFIKTNDTIKAYLRVQTLNGEKAKLGRVVTAYDFRGNGSSRKLMYAALEAINNNRAIKKAELQAQDYLKGFYASFGFQKISDVYLEDGIPHVDMELLLKN
ncbi:GNAT family N-acetyltransferase [Reichenbachiella sp.]|uniref:GNAT family N-acetyltransferase n=1 Tax=Reichenbachiella sp. TaxID=2184521 RepID=UPI003B5AFFAA